MIAIKTLFHKCIRYCRRRKVFVDSETQTSIGDTNNLKLDIAEYSDDFESSTSPIPSPKKRRIASAIRVDVENL